MLNCNYASYLYDGKKINIGKDESINNNILSATNPTISEDYAEWTLRLKNIGETNSLQLTEIYSLDFDILCSENSNVEYNSIYGDDCNGTSFIKIKRNISTGEIYIAENTTGRSSEKELFPYFDITVNNTVYVFAIGWSGCWKRIITRTENGVNIKIGQANCDFYLYPNEEARSARILIYKKENIAREDALYEFKEIIRKHYSPKNHKMPISAQTFDRYYNNNTNNFRSEKAQLEIENSISNMKNVDTFWLDAAWFKDAFPHGVGNYSFEPGFPDGLKNLSDKVHKDGKRFMVWFEPERIDIGSETYAKFHSNKKFLLNIKEKSDNRMLNLGYEPAFDYLYEIISGFIRDYKIDIFRVDHNFATAQYWKQNDEENRHGITEMRSIEGLYRFWDKLLDEFPDLMIDNCSSGGRRLDFEMLSRSVSCWRSDTGCWDDTNEVKRSIFAQNMAVGLSQYIPYHQTVSWTPKAYYIRSGMGYGIACAFDFMKDNFDTEKADEMLSEVIELSKYRNGKITEITKQSTADDIWFAYQLNIDNGGCGFSFRRDNCKDDKYIFIPKENFEANKIYNITVTDENYNKKHLSLTGEKFKSGIELKSADTLESFVIEWN